MLQHQPNKQEALSSTPSVAKTKQKTFNMKFILHYKSFHILLSHDVQNLAFYFSSLVLYYMAFLMQ
jgi:hypothetical protein